MRSVCFASSLMALVLAGASNALAAQTMMPIAPDQIANALDAYTSGFRGAAVVVGIIDGDSVSTYASGHLSSQHPPPDASTIFQIGSVTKTFTATLLAQMVLGGDVRLGDPIAAYVPPGVRVPDYGGKQISLESLAEQNSGLPRLPSNLQPANFNDPYAGYTTAMLWQFLSRYTLARAPGAAYEYSNLGVGLLGELLAERAREPIETLLQQRVTGPLQMTDTTMVLSADQRQRLAQGYTVEGHPQPPWTMGALAGAGGLYSDVRDMLRYLRANLAAPNGTLGSAIALAQTPRADDDSNGITRVGLVWLTNVANGNTFMNGETGGYHAFIAFNRFNRIGLVMLANVADLNLDALALHLVYPQMVPEPSPPGLTARKVRS